MGYIITDVYRRNRRRIDNEFKYVLGCLILYSLWHIQRVVIEKEIEI